MSSRTNRASIRTKARVGSSRYMSRLELLATIRNYPTCKLLSSQILDTRILGTLVHIRSLVEWGVCVCVCFSYKKDDIRL